MSSVSNVLYFLVSVMRAIYRKIRHARYLYIKRNVEKVWGVRYTLSARYLSKNTVYIYIYTHTHTHTPCHMHVGRESDFLDLTPRPQNIRINSLSHSPTR